MEHKNLLLFVPCIFAFQFISLVVTIKQNKNKTVITFGENENLIKYESN